MGGLTSQGANRDFSSDRSSVNLGAYREQSISRFALLCTPCVPNSLNYLVLLGIPPLAPQLIFQKRFRFVFEVVFFSSFS